MKVGIRDIAKQANTSIATVSYVLNGSEKHRISEETRQRVLKSAAELHYIPDAGAKSFKQRKRNLVGFIGPAVDNFFWASLVEHMESTLYANGLNLIISNAREDPEKELNVIKTLSAGVVDGLIIGSTIRDCLQIDSLVPKDFPLVFIDRMLINCRHDAVVISNYTCMYQAVSTLLSRGHTKIGFIAGLEHLSTTRERLRAYEDSMHDHGIAAPESLVRFEKIEFSDISPLLSSLAEAGCTALVVSNCRMTDAASVWLEKQKLVGSLELVGYYDINAVSHSPIPAVGLISQPSGLLGSKAAEVLIRRITDPTAAFSVTTLQSDLHLLTGV